MSDRITPEHITLKRAAELYPASVRNMREHCRLPRDHPFHLKHVRGPGGHIFVLPDDVADWIHRKGEDWKRKRREKDE
jgi:hypothetical protein